MRLDQLLARSRAMLADKGTADAADDSRRLVTGLLGLSLTDLIARGDMDVDETGVATVLEAIGRRASGMPVHRILGQRSFHGVELALSAETLEPRPDTEALVDLVLDLVPDRNAALRLLDLGTGTGAVALALLAQLPKAHAVMTDISSGALETALANARLNGLADRVIGTESDWFSAISGRFDVIVSNPPYIPSRDIAGLSREVREHDPLAALDGGADGLDPYQVIAASAPAFLKPGGIVAVEHGHDQATDVRAVFEAQGFSFLSSRSDHGGNHRALAFDAG